MADRAIVARLRAEANQFIATMGKARKATESVGEGAEKSSRQATKSFDTMAAKVRENSVHLDRLGNTALVAGGAITAGLGFGVKAFADFDQAMSAVTAALPEAGDQMDRLRQLAIDLGRDSQYSATEAAQGITELAKAGVSAEDILNGGLKGALDLAASGQLDVADAAETAASAMTQFGLAGDQVGHIADLLAAGAGKAQGSVADLGQALNQTGQVADLTGLSIEETVAGLSAFASAGTVGSDAGTSFKAMLQRLTPQSQEAEAMMRNLGISAYDAQGNFIGLSEFAGNLQESLADLTPEARNSALAVMFGSDAIRAANVLYREGAEGISKWEREVNAAGFAATQAAALTDNLRGDLERLGGAIDSVFVENGAGANGALRGLTQGAESLVEAFGNLPGPAQQTVLAVAGLTGAGLLAAGMFAKVVTTAADFHESLGKIRTDSPKTAKGIDMATKAAKGFAIAAAAAAAAGAVQGDISESIGVEALTKDILEAESAVGALDAAFAEAAVFNSRADSDVKSLGDALKAAFDPDLSDQIDDTAGSLVSLVGMDNLSNIAVAKQRLGELDATLTGLAASGNTQRAAQLFEQVAAAAEAQGISVEDLRAKFPQYTETLAAADNQQTLAAKSGEKVGRTLEDIAEEAQAAEDRIADLADEIRGFGSTALSADEAQDRFRDAVADASEAYKANAKAVKEGEKGKAEAARDNRDALRDVARAALDNAAATLEQTGSADKARRAMKLGRDEFIASAREAGYTAKEAENLADKYELIPAKVTTEVRAQGAETARKDVQNLIDTIKRLNDKTVTVGVRYVVTDRGNGSRGLGGGFTADADGGMHVGSPVGLVKAYAAGGLFDGSFRDAQPRIAPAGGRGILWAEEGAGPWEAFISGHPAKRSRSRVIAEDTVTRLGGRIEWARPFADGGVLQAGPSSHTETRNSPVFVTNAYVQNLGELGRRAEAEEWRRSMKGLS